MRSEPRVIALEPVEGPVTRGSLELWHCGSRTYGLGPPCPANVQLVCGLPTVSSAPSEGRVYSNRCVACEEPSVEAVFEGQCESPFPPIQRPTGPIEIAPAPVDPPPGDPAE
jgi:hypothetical protein